MNGYRFSALVARDIKGWEAFCPDFPDCRARGASYEDAVSNLKDLGDCAGALVELVVRVVDARQRVTYGGNGGPRPAGPGAMYFYLFEDETGLLEGIGESRCVTYGSPPVCLLRGEVRRDGEGVPKVYNCAFLRAF